MNDLTTSSTRCAPRASLQDFYNRELQPLCAALEAERSRVGANTKMAAIVCGIVGIIAAVFILQSGAPPFVLLIVLFVGSLIVGATYSSAADSYRRGFKMLVAERLVKFLDPQLSYNVHDSISESEFKQSALFNRRPDRFKGEDLVRGKIGETNFRFSRLHAEHKVKTKNGEQWHTIFNGLFFVADFNKNFAGTTLVLPDTAQQIFGNFGQTLQSWGTSFSGRELVRLEDPEFERAFAVYSTDQIEARYILSPAFMRRLLELKRDKGCAVYVSFVTPVVNIALPTTKTLFNPPMSGPVLPFEIVQKHLEQLNDVVEIITQLDLNTRIWSKD